MTDSVHLYPRLTPPSGPGAISRPPSRVSPQGPSFEKVFDAQLKGPSLQFSKHAISRMESRGIKFSEGDMIRLENAVQAAGAKGGRDSLVLLDQTAMVVSVKNNTVVTLVDKNSMQGNVFTNIDSAVIA